MLSWLLGTLHELAELQMDSDDIGPQLLHLSKGRFNGGPILVPLIFEQFAIAFMVIVESPGHKCLPRVCQNKSVTSLCSSELSRTANVICP
jgi:hypothetical protein